MYGTLWFIGFALFIAFVIMEGFRLKTVRGTRARYVLTGWSWTLVWPSYLGTILMFADAFAHERPVSIALFPVYVWIVYTGHRMLREDDDDNPWRKLKSRIRSGIKRMREIRLPQINPPVPAPSGA